MTSLPATPITMITRKEVRKRKPIILATRRARAYSIGDKPHRGHCHNFPIEVELQLRSIARKLVPTWRAVSETETAKDNNRTKVQSALQDETAKLLKRECLFVTNTPIHSFM